MAAMLAAQLCRNETGAQTLKIRPFYSRPMDLCARWPSEPANASKCVHNSFCCKYA